MSDATREVSSINGCCLRGGPPIEEETSKLEAAAA